MTSVDALTQPRTVDPLAHPPGRFLNGAAVALFVSAMWRGSERTGDLDAPMLIAAAWFFVLLAWLFRLIAGANGGTVRSETVINWALAPSLFVVAAVLVFGGYAAGTRFALSEGALDTTADAVTEGETVQPGWIGLYPVEAVSRVGRTVRIEIAGQLPFVRDAPPMEDSPTVWYEPVHGRWSYVIDFSQVD